MNTLTVEPARHAKSLTVALQAGVILWALVSLFAFSMIGEWWVLPAASAIPLFVYIVIVYPRVWLATFFGVLPWFLVDVGKGYDASELAIGIYLSLTVLIWTAWHLYLDYRAILKTWADALLLIFIVLSLINAIVALSNGVDLIFWASEWSLFTYMLYAFPLRHYFGGQEGIKQLTMIAGISALSLALMSFWIYKTRLADTLLYAYQIQSSRSTMLGAVVLLAAILASLAYTQTRLKYKMPSMMFMIIQVAAVLLTFTRTIWVFLIVSIFASLFFIPFRRWISMTGTMLLVGIGCIMIGYAVAPTITNAVLGLSVRRLAAAGEFKGGDRSFETRIHEADRALKYLTEAPLGGQGIRYTLLTYDAILGRYLSREFMHIGFVIIPIKMGIPFLLLLTLLLGTYAYDAWRNVRNVVTIHDRGPIWYLSIGILLYWPAIVGNIVVASWFDQRYGNVIFAFVFGVTGIIQDYVRMHRTGLRC